MQGDSFDADETGAGRSLPLAGDCVRLNPKSARV